jgi:glycosyltransferase involved in cell wall biosynthesis
MEHVLFIKRPLENAYLIWRASDIFIRATNTDGDSISVREALSMGTSVVASDASPRPKGVVLFANRDIKALINVVRQSLNEKQRVSDRPEQSNLMNNYHSLLKIYEN